MPDCPIKWSYSDGTLIASAILSFNLEVKLIFDQMTDTFFSKHTPPYNLNEIPESLSGR